MFSKYDFDNFIFFDIETVPEFKTLNELKKNNEFKYNYWVNKRHKMLVNKYAELKDYTPDVTYIEKGSIFPEFNKVISVSFSFSGESNEPTVISYNGNNEYELLKQTSIFIDYNFNFTNRLNTILWGYYSNRFDVPVLYKRMIINQIGLPQVMHFYDTKPWDIRFKDLYDLWNILYGEKISSLDLLSNLLNIPTSKVTMDGSGVYDVYYNESNIKQIADYCQRDTVLTLNILRAMSNFPYIDYDNFKKQTFFFDK